MKLDVVYILGKGSVWDNNELRYSIRSLYKYFEDLGKIWVVGENPGFINDQVRYIYHPDPYSGVKDANMINKYLRACLEKDLSDDFLAMFDDQVILKSIKKDIFRLPFAVGEYSNELKSGFNQWIEINNRTKEYLHSKGLPNVNYECHTPVIYNKSLFAKTMLEHDYGKGWGYTINTLYFNSIRIGSHFENVNSYNAGIISQLSLKQLQAVTANRYFMNYIDQAINNDMKLFLDIRFPNKSPFEK